MTWVALCAPRFTMHMPFIYLGPQRCGRFKNGFPLVASLLESLWEDRYTLSSFLLD